MSAAALESFPPGIAALVQGASRGLGLAFVRQLLAGPTPARVFATCRSAERADVLNALARSAPGRLTVLELDVTREPSIAAAVQVAAGQVEEIALIINTAGLLHDGELQPERRLTEVRPEHLHASFAVNAIGPLLVAKHFSSLLPRRDRAVFASLSARVGSIGDNRLGGWYAYRGSKAAQNMFTRCLSIELPRRHRGLICVALHPGTVDTDLSRPFQANVAPEKLFDAGLAARQLLAVIDGLQPGDNGRFLAWDGQDIAW